MVVSLTNFKFVRLIYTMNYSKLKYLFLFIFQYQGIEKADRQVTPQWHCLHDQAAPLQQCPGSI